MENKKALIFDLGGVLIDIDYQATEDAFIALGTEDFAERYTQFAQQDLFDLFETGQISPQHFVNKVLPLTRPGTTPNQVVAAWNAMLGGFPKEKIDYLLALKKHRPIYLLSNTNAIHWEVVKQQWKKKTDNALEAVFDRIFLSHEIQMRKPHVATYNWVLDQIELANDEVLFIDDSPQHVAGAKKAGITSFLYVPGTNLAAYFS
ncbi:MAG: hypothetical protein RLZZ65_1782 [Bacteroidota bacterium]|jgi:putative hydrolase of the HAD superfamily